MRIVVDLQCLQTSSKYRGIGRYAIGLTRALIKNNKDHEVWISLRKDHDGHIDAVRAEFPQIYEAGRFNLCEVFHGIEFSNPANAWKRIISDYVWSLNLSALGADIVLCPSPFEGFDQDAVSTRQQMGQFAVAAIIHDLFPYHDPCRHIGSRLACAWYNEKLSAVLNSRLLFTNSMHTRNDVVETLNYPVDRIDAISAAVDMNAISSPPAADENDVIERLGLGGGFVFYAGSLETRKNVDLLLRAFTLMPDRFKTSLKIVLAGHADSGDVERTEKIARACCLTIGKQVVFAGFLSDSELAILYRNCQVFVFPSLNEGFGLPVLEAMAAGAPVLSSDRGSLPEVVGRPDLMFDPFDAVGLRDKMLAVLEQPGRRRAMVEYGLSRAASFSWDTTARKVTERLEREVAMHRANAPLVGGAARYFDYVRAVEGISRTLRDFAVDPAGLSEATTLIQKAMSPASFPPHDAGFRLPSWRIEGPFDSSYSLSLVNRETARALSRLGVRASLFSTEGPGDFDPNPSFLRSNPDIAELCRAPDDEDQDCTVVSRLLYPPRATDMGGSIKMFHHYAWEETGFPDEWMVAFNQHLNGFTCASEHVKKIMIDQGLRIPMSVTGNGVDHWDLVGPDEDFHVEARSYRFLHVSSCFPRKGVDCLLRAFAQAYTDDDDVSLIIKTADNPHNSVREDLARLRAGDPGFPDAVVIDQDLTDAQMKSLYAQCHALVAPSRAEGFGLPAAEAMLQGLPVIATGWSGLAEFCDEETSWPIDYTFRPAASHFDLPTSVWAEPDVDQLADRMREVRATPARAIRAKTTVAATRLRERFTWDRVARRLETYAAATIAFSRAPTETLKVGWVTTWNSRCGIATYSRHLLELHPDVQLFAPCTDDLMISDGGNVLRNWMLSAGSLDRLAQDIFRSGVNLVVVQFNYAFFEMNQFARLLERLFTWDLVVVVEVHATHESDPDQTKRLRRITGVLNRCDRILVHSVRDMNRLKDMGLVDNVTLFPHPYLDLNLASDQPITRRGGAKRPVIASYGFFLPTKGLLELVDAFRLLIDNGLDGELLLVNAEYPASVSREAIARCRARIDEAGLEGRVRLVTEFLPEAESLALLRQADLIVLPYQPEAGDSASGAVRMCLSSGRPVAVSPLAMFDDVEGAVIRLEGWRAVELASGLEVLLKEIAEGSGRLDAIAARARALAGQSSFGKMSNKLFAMLEGLHVDRQFARFREGRSLEARSTAPAARQAFWPRDGLVRTAVGEIGSDGCLRSTGRSGKLTFGPYMLLKPGRHLLAIYGELRAGKADLRVAIYKDDIELHASPIEPASRKARGCIVQARFEVTQFVDGVEIVIFVDEDTDLSVDWYCVEECWATGGVSP